uniref:Uncharacterized protein n=1 Tax=Bionectria ochroleuca TaxID=29856 RepID=A0A0B7KSC4_BIOOC
MEASNDKDGPKTSESRTCCEICRYGEVLMVGQDAGEVHDSNRARVSGVKLTQAIAGISTLWRARSGCNWIN